LPIYVPPFEEATKSFGNQEVAETFD